jgi:cation:H+ antiporter
MLTAVVIAGGGLLLLLGGGEVLLRGAVALARRLGLSPLLIGLTVVAAGTSMPELVVAVSSGLAGVPDLGVGNVVGSNIANILLILGAAAVVWPVATRPQHILRDGMAVLAATALFLVFAVIGPIGRLEGLLMLALLTAYLVFSYVSDRRAQDVAPSAGAEAEDAVEQSVPAPGLAASVLLVAAGVGALVAGSQLLIDGAVDIARAIGVSEAVIGLTMIAIGTSLPELTTAVIAGLRHHSEIALGNVLGSNMFNILAILPALALVTPFHVAPEMLRLDIWVMAAAVLILLPVMFTGWRIGRREGVLFLVLYGLYIALKYEPAVMAG